MGSCHTCMPARKQCKRSYSVANLQVSTSKQQHYMRARLQRAGDYSLAVSVTDPAAQQQALPVRPHGASARVRIVPGPLVPARTRITGLPATLTAGACCNIT